MTRPEIPEKPHRVRARRREKDETPFRTGRVPGRTHFSARNAQTVRLSRTVSALPRAAAYPSRSYAFFDGLRARPPRGGRALSYSLCRDFPGGFYALLTGTAWKDSPSSTAWQAPADSSTIRPAKGAAFSSGSSTRTATRSE